MHNVIWNILEQNIGVRIDGALVLEMQNEHHHGVVTQNHVNGNEINCAQKNIEIMQNHLVMIIIHVYVKTDMNGIALEHLV